MRMSLKHSWSDSDTEIPAYSEINFFQCDFSMKNLTENLTWKFELRDRQLTTWQSLMENVEILLNSSVRTKQ
jgi:hypothetical protein